MSLALELHAVSKRFVVGAARCIGSVEALRSVDLQLSAGDAIGIVGGSGAGKSTLLLCAAGLLTTDSGRVRWFGESERAAAVRRATYYFVGSASPVPERRARPSVAAGVPRAPHIHLIDGPPIEALSLETTARMRRWVERRCAQGDAVLIAARGDSLVREIVPRTILLRAGRIYGDERSAFPARVAERLPF